MGLTDGWCQETFHSQKRRRLGGFVYTASCKEDIHDLDVAGGMTSQSMVVSPPAMYECRPDQGYALVQWSFRKLVEQPEFGVQLSNRGDVIAFMLNGSCQLYGLRRPQHVLHGNLRESKAIDWLDARSHRICLKVSNLLSCSPQVYVSSRSVARRL